ncbi:MAG: hypothetical protein Q9183_007704 [Haloplaca sp. 2 TL-2023]
MTIVGVSVLGNLNKEATSQKSLGTSYWRIVISSGIIVIIMGVANIFASYIFRQKKSGVTARQVRAYGAVAAQKLPLPVTAMGTPASSVYRSDTKSLRPLHLGRADTVAGYHGNGSSPVKTTDPRRNISAPMNNVQPNQFVRFNERCEGVGSPDLAHHPAMTGGRF